MRQRLLAVLNGATWTLLLLVVIGGIVALAWGLYALIHPLISWLPLTLQVAVTAVLTTLLVSGSSQLLKRRRSRRR